MASEISDLDVLGRVYRAVAAGQSASTLRRLIERCSRGSAARRALAVDRAAGPDGETPLQAAHRLRRGDLVGALLEAGADAKKLFDNPNTSPVAVCIAYGQAGSLRALLRSGRADANEALPYNDEGDLAGVGDGSFCTAAHLCIMPPLLSPHHHDDDDDGDDDDEEGGPGARPAQLECLKVLVREGGAHVNARDSNGFTPLYWCCFWQGHPQDAAELLFRFGADANARSEGGQTAIFSCGSYPDVPLMRLLLEHGASADVVNEDGETPLMRACARSSHQPGGRDVVLALLRRSTLATRRAVFLYDGSSAIDLMIECLQRAGVPLEQWQERVIAELLASGAPVQLSNLPVVLPIAARLAEERGAELEARRCEARRWRAHDDVVGLALVQRDAREADEAVAAAERRVEALEEELRELGWGETETETDEESGSEGEEGGGEEEDEGAGAGGGGPGE